MATISYVINAINNASRTLNDIATSAAKLDATMDALQRTADQLNTTLAAQDLAAQAASAGLEKVARSAYGAAAAQTAAAAAARDFAASTVASSGAATIAYGRWGLLWGILNRPVSLFGGAATIGGLHLLVDVFFEFLAVVIPASIALAAFGALAGPIFVDMYNHLVNVYDVVTATGKAVYPFTSQLSRLQNAVKPEAYILFGDALYVAGQKTSELGVLAISTGKVLDNFGNRVAAALTSGGMSQFLKQAIPDVQKLGDIVASTFGTIGNILHAVPGYAQYLLTAVDTTTRTLESVTSSGAVQGILHVGLAAHGAFIYLGLLGTAAGYLTRVGLVGVSRAADLAQEGLFNIGLGGTRAASAMSALSESAGAASMLPWGWIAVAAAAVGFLVYKLLTAKDALQTFVATAQGKALGASGTAGLSSLAQEIAQINSRIGGTQATLAAGGLQGAAGTGSLQFLASDKSATQAQLQLFNEKIAQLGQTYKSTQVAQDLFVQSGLTVGDMISKNASQQAQDKAALTGVYDVYRAMGQPGGAIGADIIVMGRLNGVTSEQVKQIAALNGAWDQFLAAVTGPQTTFDTYAQGLTALNAAQKTATDRLGQYSAAVKLSGGVMDGTSAASVALNQAFTTQVSSATSLIDAWRTAGITGNQLEAGVKALVDPLTKFARGSGEATAQLAALASEAGYRGPTTLHALEGWLGLTGNALERVKQTSDAATIQEALLTSALQGQGGVIANQLIGDLDNAILKYSGVYTAVVAYGKAVAQDGAQSAAAHQKRQQVIDDIIKAGEAYHNTTGEIAAMISKVLKIPLKTAMQIVVSAKGAWQVVQDQGKALNSPLTRIPTAAGWYVSGGTPGVDSVPIMAMAGELVVPRHLVDSGATDHLRGKIPGYAAGGVVGSYGSSAPAAASGLGTWTQGEYAKTVTAVASSTAAATAAGVQSAMVAAAFGGSPYGATSGGANAALARRMMPAWGSGAEWNAWNYVGMRESGWNAYAANPTSDARGIAQNIAGWGPNYQPGNAAQQIAWMIRYISCMPLDTQILTRRGWLTHEELREGDETVGYDPQTGRARWTRVTAIHRYDEAPLVRMSNKRFDVRCTPNHRWVTDKLIQSPDGNYRREEFTETRHLGTRHRLRLAATQDDSDGLPVSLAEAELMGWIAGDGYVSHYRSRTPGSTHWRAGTGSMRRLGLVQAKPRRIGEIDALVAGMPFSRHEQPPRGISRLPQVRWQFGAKFSADLLERSGYERDLEAMVLAMSRTQREAFLRGLLGADGHGRDGCSPLLAQNAGAVLDAAVLAMYLTGHYPHLTDSAGQKNVHKHVSMGKATVKAGLRLEQIDPAPVWCVTTELGSWTARQSGQVFLTGNSRYGDPIHAAAHERGFNWYGGGLSGGIFSSPTMIGVGDGGPERVDITPLGGAGGSDAKVVQLLTQIRDGIDDLYDALTGTTGTPSPAMAPLAGAGGRLSGYKKMFDTRG